MSQVADSYGYVELDMWNSQMPWSQVSNKVADHVVLRWGGCLSKRPPDQSSEAAGLLSDVLACCVHQWCVTTAHDKKLLLPAVPLPVQSPVWCLAPVRCLVGPQS